MENICEMKNATIKQIDEFIEIYNNDEIKYFNILAGLLILLT